MVNQPYRVRKDRIILGPGSSEALTWPDKDGRIQNPQSIWREWSYSCWWASKAQTSFLRLSPSHTSAMTTSNGYPNYKVFPWNLSWWCCNDCSQNTKKISDNWCAQTCQNSINIHVCYAEIWNIRLSHSSWLICQSIAWCPGHPHSIIQHAIILDHSKSE